VHSEDWCSKGDAFNPPEDPAPDAQEKDGVQVLLISYHYPPDPAVGAVRAERVAEALRSAGHDVQVVTVRRDGLDAPEDRLRIHRVRRLPNAREAALAVRGLVRRPRPAVQEGGGNPTGWTVPDHVPRWKRFLVAMALLPDDHQGFVLPALLRSLRILRRGVDLIYTSGPPHSAHLVGLGLKWLTGVRWAAEFRDPWTDNAVRPRYAVSGTAFAIQRWMERKTLAGADQIIAVSDAAGRLFEAKTERLASREIVVVRNGIEQLEPPADLSPRQGPIQIVYLGGLYHGRDPRPFLEALAVLRDRGARGLANLRVDFYGDCRRYRGIAVEAVVRDLGLASIVQIHDAVHRSAVPALMANADLLLLLAQQQPVQVPAKLYEYLAARRPILAFADADGETAEMLRQAGGHALVPATATAEAVIPIVEQAIAGARDWVSGNEDVLEEWSAPRQMSRLVEVLTSRPQ
jgi:glycosyltransferase involved in cell wall biosynthesis